MAVTKEQDYISRIGGLHIGFERTLDVLIEKSGTSAKQIIERLRDEIVSELKTSGINAERELDHAGIVGPSILVVEIVFNAALERIPK